MRDNSITDFDAYDRLSDWLDAFQDLHVGVQLDILTRLNAESRRQAKATIDLYVPRSVWKNIVACEGLSADVEESL